MKATVDQETCTGCGRCVAACRLRAMSLQPEWPNGFGRKRVVVLEDRCTGCGECLPVCPYGSLVFPDA